MLPHFYRLHDNMFSVKSSHLNFLRVLARVAFQAFKNRLVRGLQFRGKLGGYLSWLPFRQPDNPIPQALASFFHSLQGCTLVTRKKSTLYLLCTLRWRNFWVIAGATFKIYDTLGRYRLYHRKFYNSKFGCLMQICDKRKQHPKVNANLGWKTGSD